MKKTLVTILAAGVVAIGGVALAISPDQSSSTAEASAESEATSTFDVENMTCGTCPISVKKAMNRVEGVKSVEIDFKTKKATVVYDSNVATADQIAAASTDVGYPATEVTEL